MTAAAATSAGVYDVTGTDQDGLPAIAKIDPSGGVAIQALVPDLMVSGETVSPTPAVTTDSWGVKAILTNLGTATAAPVTVQYWVSTIATFDSTAHVLDTSTITSLPVGVTTLVTSPQSYSLDKLYGTTAAGTYYVGVTVSTPGEIDVSDNTLTTTITVQAPATSVSTTYNEIVIDTYDPVNPGVQAPLHDTYMELWSSDGKTLTLLASNDSGTGSGRQRGVGSGFAYIDTSAFGLTLTSGDYYVLVSETPSANAAGALSAADAFGYAIRVMVAPSQYGTAASDWGFGAYATETQSDLPIPSAPLVGPGGLPTRFQTMALDTSNPPVPTATNHLNRYLIAGGVNWVKIHLP
jgi:hypothetical protein